MIHSVSYFAIFIFNSVRFLSHYETRDGYYSMLSYVRVSFLSKLIPNLYFKLNQEKEI